MVPSGTASTTAVSVGEGDGESGPDRADGGHASYVRVKLGDRLFTLPREAAERVPALRKKLEVVVAVPCNDERIQPEVGQPEAEADATPVTITLDTDVLDPAYAPTVFTYLRASRKKHLFTHLPRTLDPRVLFDQLFTNLRLELPLPEPTEDYPTRLSTISARLKDLRRFRDDRYDGRNDYAPSDRPRARDAVVEMCVWFQTELLATEGAAAKEAASKARATEDKALDAANGSNNGTSPEVDPEKIFIDKYSQVLFVLIIYVLSHPRTFNYGTDMSEGDPLNMNRLPGLLMHHTVQWYLSERNPFLSCITKKMRKQVDMWMSRAGGPEYDDDPNSATSSGGSDLDDEDNDDEDSRFVDNSRREQVSYRS